METYIQQLILVLCGFAYVSMVLALLHAVHDFRAGQNVTKYIVYLICLTAFLAFYNPVLDYGCNMFDQGVSDVRTQMFQIWDSIDKSCTEKSNIGSGVEKYFLIPVTKGLLHACKVFHWISSIVRTMFKIIYRISAPLAIGLAAWRVFMPVGIRFAAGTLWLCCWAVGCAIADVLLFRIAVATLGKTVLLGASGAGGMAAARMVIAGTAKIAVLPAVLWTLIFALLIFLATAIMLYILMPIALYHIICAGDVVQGATHAMAGAIGGGMFVNNAIGKTFGKSGNGGGTGAGGPPPAESPAGAGTAGNSVASSGGSGSGNTRANRSHAALAESAERQLENRNA